MPLPDRYPSASRTSKALLSHRCSDARPSAKQELRNRMVVDGLGCSMRRVVGCGSANVGLIEQRFNHG